MREVYKVSVVLTAVSIFWPVLYGSIKTLRRIPGNPTLQALIGTIFFGLLAYTTYEEDRERDITAS